jgi:predicted outer membrane protein
VSIHQQFADQCLKTTKTELEKKEGAEFDQCYMGHELMTHLITIDQLTVLKNHASPTLRADIDKSLQMAQGHLREARQILEQMKGEGGAEPRVSRTPGKAAPPSRPAVPKTNREE